VPLPDYADSFIADVNERSAFGSGSLVDALLKSVRDKTQLDVKRNDFKLEQLPPHLFMNFRVVDEHGRQLGTGRNLASLKAELGGQARSAFQALAALRPGLPSVPAEAPVAVVVPTKATKTSSPQAASAAAPAEVEYTDWTFGELPELMEVRRGNQTLVGFPALIDRGNHVLIEVFDEPDIATSKHRAGLRRLVALQIRDALKYMEKNPRSAEDVDALHTAGQR
jgi:ATP-dependent helicase HrpA